MSGQLLRRVVTATASAALAVTLVAACGSNDKSSSNASSGSGSGPSWCGKKPLVFGMQDGGGLNAWSKASATEVKKTVSMCPNISKTLTVNAQFDLQKGISGLQGMVAQGAKAIVIIPDAGGSGAAELAGIHNATNRGVTMVPWASDPGGKAGRDYLAYVDSDHKNDGKVW